MLACVCVCACARARLSEHTITVINSVRTNLDNKFPSLEMGCPSNDMNTVFSCLRRVFWK